MVQDLQPCGVRPPVSSLDRRGSALDAQSICVSTALSAKLAPDSVFSEGERSEHVLKADFLNQISRKTIPASEKMKWAKDRSLGLQHVFNASGGLECVQ